MSAPEEGTDLYVAVLLPFADGSGEPVVLGVYSTREWAEARCWRALQRLGYDQPTEVVHRPLDFHNEGDEESLAVEVGGSS